MSLKFVPYSFSKMDVFSQCPLKFKFQYIDKIYFKSTHVAFEKGSYIHLVLENHANFGGIDIEKAITDTSFKFRLSTPENIDVYKNIIRTFVNSDIGVKYFKTFEIKSAEQQFGLINEGTKLVDTSYFNKKALLRGKIDQISFDPKENEWNIIDWKSGSVPETLNPKQIGMYALWFMTKYPEVGVVNTTFVYIEHSKEKLIRYTRDDLPALRQLYAMDIKKIELESNFNKKESHLCVFCDYRKHGLCEEEKPSTHEFSMFKVELK